MKGKPKLELHEMRCDVITLYQIDKLVEGDE